MRVPLPHQQRALATLQSKGSLGLFFAPGTGKTLIAIRGSCGATLVLCRRQDYLTWRLELAEEGIPDTDVYSIKEGSSWLPYKDEFPWILCSYDLLKGTEEGKKRKENKAIIEWAKKYGFDTLILDESHYIKTWGTARTKAIVQLAKSLHSEAKTILLSGTPITNNLEDIFPQAYLIDGGRTFGTSLWGFRRKYYYHIGKMFIPRPGGIGQIKRKLKSIAVSCELRQVVSLPPIVRKVLPAVLTKQQDKYYREIVEDWKYHTETPGVTVELKYVIQCLEKLRQVCNGFIYPSSKAIRRDGSPTEHKLIDIPTHKYFIAVAKAKEIQQTGAKVILWTSHREECYRAYSALHKSGTGFLSILPDESVSNRERTLQEFHRTNAAIAILAPVSVGVSTNMLLSANHMIYLSNTHSVAARIQSEGRINRKGAERHKQLHIYDIVTEDTVEEKILLALSRKIDLSKQILSNLSIIA